MDNENYRDLNMFLQKVNPKLVYRSAIHFLLNEEKFNNHFFNTIIDLRAKRERLTHPHPIEQRTSVNRIQIPFDPWNQPKWFIENYQIGSNPEIAYRFFIMCCQEQVVSVLNQISISNGSVLIHCHAGKDRTGIIAAILGLLVGENLENILQDYLASESDTSPELILIALDFISDKGGIENYLIEAGMTIQEIDAIKQKLTKR